jgi:hypothetical protein
LTLSSLGSARSITITTVVIAVISSAASSVGCLLHLAVLVRMSVFDALFFVVDCCSFVVCRLIVVISNHLTYFLSTRRRHLLAPWFNKTTRTADRKSLWRFQKCESDARRSCAPHGHGGATFSLLPSFACIRVPSSRLGINNRRRPAVLCSLFMHLCS